MILEGMATGVTVAQLTDDHAAKLSALLLDMEQETSREDGAQFLLIHWLVSSHARRAFRGRLS